MDEQIFRQEQDHLTKVYGELSDMQRDLTEQIASVASQASAERQDIRDNMSLNFDSDTDSMETYIEFETMTRSIDQYNIERDAAQEKLQRVERLLEAPYFARITLQFDPDEEPEDYYIGSTGVSENAFHQIVLDWRSPVAEVYYNQENGHTSYEVNGRKVEVDLKLRRQFDLVRDTLRAYFDTQVAIEDPLLLQSLTKRRSDRMEAITATIQKEQNAVIRFPDVPVLLVNGIAGSGKTSVLLQRIAYLFFKKRDTLRPEHVYLLTLNPVFRRYISRVLPDLGERNPVTVTWSDFMSMRHVPLPASDDRTDAESLERIDSRLHALKFSEEDFIPVRQKGAVILSSGDILSAVRRHSHLEVGERLINVVLEDLKDTAGSVIKRASGQGRETDPEAPDESSEGKQIENQFGGAFGAINRFAWLNIDSIGRKLTGKKRLTAVQWYYVKLALTGECDRNIRYVMVDEVQNYTKAQLMVLRRYFVNAHFLLLGDEFQAIYPGKVRFTQIHELFEAHGTEVTELPLMTSYRSSPEITELFTSLLPDERRVLTASVRRPGLKPEILSFENKKEYAEDLAARILRAREETEGITAVICRNKKSLCAVQEIIENSVGDASQVPHVMKRNEGLPGSGVILIPLDLAGGLEFDSVIVPDADERMYPDDTLSRHRLYTALSRATQRLCVLSDGPLTPLLLNNHGEKI